MTAIRPIGHEDRLSLIEHLDELRTRLILCLVAFILAFSLCYWQNERLLDWINRPLEHSQRVDCTKKKIKDPLELSSCFDKVVGSLATAVSRSGTSTAGFLRSLAADPQQPRDVRARAATAAREQAAMARAGAAAAAATPKVTGRQPVTLGVTEPFVTTVTVAAYSAVLLALPFILWQAYAFILPAFTREERRTALPLMGLIPALFVAGVAFGYFLALPRAVTFLQNFNDNAFDILLQAKDYYRFSVLLLAGMGFMFQIPVGILAIVRLGLLSVSQLRASRGYAIVLFAIIAAVVTPTPDPFTMLITMAPLVVLFELSLILARVLEPRTSRWSWRDDEDTIADDLD